MIVQMAVTNFIVCMLIAAFLDLSFTGRRLLRLTDAMYSRNEAGSWVGIVILLLGLLLIVWYILPAALLSIPAGMAGMATYLILSSHITTVDPKGVMHTLLRLRAVQYLHDTSCAYCTEIDNKQLNCYYGSTFKGKHCRLPTAQSSFLIHLKQHF
ncbi:MAG: hypothetical protein UY35_C0024G0016 [Candidatus Saccharibacteria bacterium GW2011_GWC2_48_9]|nr:MAG: hypothetical protein UY35_C0024G0016 [Candidatus Saccharibacteria bacterium GW2011_GWC2_48_9]